MNNIGSKVIETERLVLKPQTMDEQKTLWQILMIPEVNKYYLAVPKKLREKLIIWDLQEPFYKQQMEHANDPDVYKWSVFIKNSPICIGRVDCHDRSTEDINITDPSIKGVGWYLDPKYKGHGYGTEAAFAMMDYMFSKVGIEEIITGAATCNHASWNIMEKFGFMRLDKTVYEEYTFQDEPVEAYRYIITKDMFFDKQNNKESNLEKEKIK